MLRPVIGPDRPLGLGSTSPRRRELLEAIGLRVHIAAPQADETLFPHESADAYLERVVQLKLESVAIRHTNAPVGAWLVADTVVVVDEAVLGKPTGLDDARRMLGRLSGRVHQVKTRFAIGAPGRSHAPAALHAQTVCSDVWFRPLDSDEIDWYAASGEGFDKAGAYAIQGIGAFAIAKIDGSYSNVVGLPLCEVVVALRRTGLLARFPLAGDAAVR
jgi:septum formation protein